MALAGIANVCLHPRLRVSWARLAYEFVLSELVTQRSCRPCVVASLPLDINNVQGKLRRCPRTKEGGNFPEHTFLAARRSRDPQRPTRSDSVSVESGGGY